MTPALLLPPKGSRLAEPTENPVPAGAALGGLHRRPQCGDGCRSGPGSGVWKAVPVTGCQTPWPHGIGPPNRHQCRTGPRKGSRRPGGLGAIPADLAEVPCPGDD